jgi:hypothetical protein
MINGKLYALVNTPNVESVTITGMGIPTDPTQSNQPVDIGDVITKSDKTQPTRATRPPRQPVSTSEPTLPTFSEEITVTENFPSVTPLPPASDSSEAKQPNVPVKINDINSLITDRLEEEKATAQKEMDDSLAKLAKLAIEQKKIDATLALVRKIKSPSLRAKTLSDLATYIAHDPNFKYEAQVLFKEAAVATLALDELELEALPELKELTTITAKKVNTPTPAAPTVPSVTKPTLPPTEDTNLTIPEQIDSTPKPLGTTPAAPPRLTGTNPIPPPTVETPTAPTVVAPATDTNNPDVKTNIPQPKRRSMPSITPPVPETPTEKPALTDEVQEDDDVTLEPKRSK